MADPTFIGIHVSGGILRRAELSRRPGGIEILRLEESPFAASPGTPAHPVNETLHAISSNGSRCVAAMPAVDVMTRCWPLPLIPDHKLKLMVAHQLEADLPVPMDQIAWDYRRATSTGAADGQCTILAQATRSERIAHYLTSLSIAGIHLDLLTTEAEGLTGLYRHALKPAGPGSVALVLAGSTDWLLCIFSGGLAQVVRRIRTDPQRPEASCRECRQILASTAASSPIESIRLCSAKPSPDLAAMLAEICNIPVQPAEPAENLSMFGGQPLPDEQLAQFGVAIGLALAWPTDDRERPIRLAGQERSEDAKPLARLERVLARTWTWTAVAAGLLIIATAIHIASLRSQTRRMQAALERGSADTTAVDQLKPRIRAVQRLERYRIDVEAFCADIAGAIKDPITITSLNLSREHRLTLKGTSKDPKAIFTFADDLRKSTRLKNVNLERTAPTQGGEFVISAEPVGFEKFSSPGLRGAR